MKVKKGAYLNLWFIAIALINLSDYAYAEVQVNATRVIFNGGDKEANVLVKNRDKQKASLVQSWVDDVTSEKTPDFMIVPPLFLLNTNEEAVLRIKKINKKLPEDKESLFWLNVKNIAPTDPDTKNKLLINYRTRIKLIYRPESLTKNREDISNAYKKVTVSKVGSGIKMTNPTPYYINFNKVVVNGKEVLRPGYIEPFNSKFYSGYSNDNVAWQVINDFGGVSELFTPKK